jgi:pimeloyl-ACP methyl ester carboxylesterase
VYVPYNWRYDGRVRVVIWLHGSGGDYRVGPTEKWLMEQLPCPWVCALLGGADTWMGATVIARITAAFDWAKANLGVRPDTAMLWGGSMGGGNALQYALEHPENVAAVGGAIPALDPEFVRSNNVGGRQAAIEAIHGVGAVPVAKQPVLHGADWNPGVAAKLWYSTDDPYTPAASVQGFAAAAGVQAVGMGALGHAYENQLYQAADVRDFLAAHA